jgi:hypothetical protein
VKTLPPEEGNIDIAAEIDSSLQLDDEDEVQEFEHTVKRGPGGLGLMLEHEGVPPNFNCWIDGFVLGGAAAESGELLIGDIIMAINGTKTCTLDNDSLLGTLMKPELVLSIHRKKGAAEAAARALEEGGESHDPASQLASGEANWHGPIFARFPRTMGRRLSQEWEKCSFSLLGAKYLLIFPQNDTKNPRLTIALSHQIFTSEAKNQNYAMSGPLDTFSICKRSGSVTGKVVKLASDEPGLVPKLCEALAKVVEQKKASRPKRFSVFNA